MNKVILMGRLTKDPEVKYSNSAQPVAVARYALAVNRQFKKEGQPEADFINCVAFGKSGEFAQKYFKKGQMVSVCGRLQISHMEDPNTQKRTYYTDVVVEDQYFAESKQSFETRMGSAPAKADKNNDPDKGYYADAESFTPIDEHVDEGDLPF